MLEKADGITANTIYRFSDKADERRQRVLIRLSSVEKPESIHDHVDWLENALPGELSASDKLTDPEQDHDTQ